MWFKLDDGFATHPKILRAGIEATVLQIRALCYAAQNKTDGLLPLAVIPMLTTDIAVRAPDMVRFGLWDCRESEYFVHDYLEWNLSKAEYLEMKEKLSRAGRKGMRRRWKGITKVITHPVTSHDNPAITSLSTSTLGISALDSSESGPNLQSSSQTKTKGKRAIADSDKPTEKHLNFARTLGIDPGPEWGKFKNYCLAHDKRYANFEAAFRNWLANADSMKGARR